MQSLQPYVRLLMVMRCSVGGLAMMITKLSGVVILVRLEKKISCTDR